MNEVYAGTGTRFKYKQDIVVQIVAVPGLCAHCC